MKKPVALRTVPLVLATLGIRFPDEERELDKFIELLSQSSSGARNLKVTVSVGRDFLFIRAQNHSFEVVETMAKAFGTILRLAAESLNLKELHRVGARYVNEFQHPDNQSSLEAWQGLLNKRLVELPGPPEFAHPQEYVQALMAEYPDSTMDMRFGKLDENPEKFFLDTDIFSLKPRPAEPDQITRLLEGYQTRLYQLFRWSVTDKFFRLLRGGHNALQE
ncbi:TIGR04255 family protein [bacterium]|nr:TIGR04255 family protein [bacterium]